MAWDRLQFGSITIRFRGTSQPASENLWTAHPSRRRRANRPDEGEYHPLRLAPRAMFTLDLLSACGARGKLADMFAKRLSEQFSPVQVVRRMIYPVSFLLFKVGEIDYSVGITRKRPRGPQKGEWFVRIDPVDAASGIKNSTIDEQRTYARDLRLICDEIHAVLATTPGISRLRWFFEGWDVKKPGVRTPAELPWHADFSESRLAPHLSERRSMSRVGRVIALMQRHPLLCTIFGHVIVVGRLLGIMIGSVGIYLSLRFVVGLAYGARIANLWLSGLIGLACIVIGVFSLTVLMPVYRVQRTTNSTPDNRST